MILYSGINYRLDGRAKGRGAFGVFFGRGVAEFDGPGWTRGRRRVGWAMMTTSRILEAVSFGARVHDGHRRSDGKTPYHAHPVRVAWIVAGWGCEDEDALITALLHDVIEDSTTDYDDLAERFGTTVAEQVAWLSRDYRLPAERQGEVYYAGLATAPWRVRLVKLADGFDNLTDAGAEKLATAKRTLGLLGAGDEPPLVRARAALGALIAQVERGR